MPPSMFVQLGDGVDMRTGNDRVRRSPRRRQSDGGSRHTSQDAIADVLSALAATFNVQYRTGIPLDAAASKSYAGSFRQVISRLLDGYNYVIK